MQTTHPGEDRLGVMAEYYAVDRAALEGLVKISHPERKIKCQQLGVHPGVYRTMVDYTRYFEATRAHELLAQCQQALSGLAVLDFGCLVSDYGIYFARRGARVTIYDGEAETKFAAFRFRREGLPVESFCLPGDFQVLMAGKGLVVFGEVLEHLDDPLAPLQACDRASVPYIFTSCYPFGDDAYFNYSGHKKSAQALQPACLELLRGNYEEIHSHKKARLWRRMDANGRKAK